MGQEPEAERRPAFLAAVQQGAVGRWRHGTLQGEYAFSAEHMPDSVGLDPLPALAFSTSYAGREGGAPLSVPVKLYVPLLGSPGCYNRHRSIPRSRGVGVEGGVLTFPGLSAPPLLY